MSPQVLRRKDQTPGAGLRSVIAAQDSTSKSFDPLYSPPEDVSLLTILSYPFKGYYPQEIDNLHPLSQIA